MDMTTKALVFGLPACLLFLFALLLMYVACCVVAFVIVAWWVLFVK